MPRPLEILIGRLGFNQVTASICQIFVADAV